MQNETIGKADLVHLNCFAFFFRVLSHIYRGGRGEKEGSFSSRETFLYETSEEKVSHCAAESFEKHGKVQRAKRYIYIRYYIYVYKVVESVVSFRVRYTVND